MFRSGLNLFPVVGAATGTEYEVLVVALGLELNDRESTWLDEGGGRVPADSC